MNGIIELRGRRERIVSVLYDLCNINKKKRNERKGGMKGGLLAASCDLALALASVYLQEWVKGSIPWKVKAESIIQRRISPARDQGVRSSGHSAS